MSSSVIGTTTRAGSVRRVAVASLIGTTIEWYDFFLYATAAALVFNKLFFPTFDAFTGTLAAFATYTVGFVARPLGGIIVGHYGDKVGRKSMLVLTLVIMGLATFAIGLLPTYEQLGPWAAVGLVVLRLLQGFGVGGEWGGAVLMAVEHAPHGKRGFYGSFPQIGVPAGLLLSTLVFASFARLPAEQFMTWGWRVPFLASILLVGVGLVIRLRILETPSFERMKELQVEARRPLLEVLTQYPRQVLLAAGTRIAENGAFYIYSVYVLTYATQQVKLERATVLDCLSIAAAAEILAIPAFGALSDRFGRRPVYLFGAIVTALFAYPLFRILDTGDSTLITIALAVALVFSHAAMYAPQAALFAELFATRVRYSGASLGSQLASVIAGGLSPFIATALFKVYGTPALVAYLIGMAVITVVSLRMLTETAHGDVINST